MPRLWEDTIEAHRNAVREAVLSATVRLACELGPLNVTMSQVAEASGIGRATLYKYFTSVDEILRTWHEQQVDHHLAVLTECAQRQTTPEARLRSVLEAYATMQRHKSHHDRELVAFLHDDQRLSDPKRRLHTLLRDTIGLAAGHGHVRVDVAPSELATYCLHALNAAGDLPSAAATQRLVNLVHDALRADLDSNQ